MDFEIIKKADLSQAEFALMVGGVSRPTVSLWVTGRFKPNRYLRANVECALNNISAAIAKGELPLKNAVGATKREAALKRIIPHAQAVA